MCARKQLTDLLGAAIALTLPNIRFTARPISYHRSHYPCLRSPRGIGTMLYSSVLISRPILLLLSLPRKENSHASYLYDCRVHGSCHFHASCIFGNLR